MLISAAIDLVRFLLRCYKLFIKIFYDLTRLHTEVFC